MERATNFLCLLVSGDHTRAIQIATPTVGGLMKFTVKTATCLGCKTPLRPTNSRKSKRTPILLVTLLRYHRWGRLQQLSTTPWRVVSKANRSDIQAADRLWTFVDTMSTLPGLLTSGLLCDCATYSRSHLRLGRPMHEQGLPHLLYAEESTKGCGGCCYNHRSVLG